jgi:hypothetical protein
LIDDHVEARTKLLIQILFQTAAPEEVLERAGEAAEDSSEHARS